MHAGPAAVKIALPRANRWAVAWLVAPNAATLKAVGGSAGALGTSLTGLRTSIPNC
ncbi:MAG TPA: hypothetical protein VLR26_00930 [Frankiaceae bacterium]|nr:hypothetical protein [Frankiaceae bacterium]